MNAAPRAASSQTEAVPTDMAATPATAFQQLAEMIPQLAWTAHADGRFDYVNRHWLHYTGLTLQPGQSMSWHDLKLHADDLDALQQAWRAALEQHVPFDMECRIQHRDGSYRWFKTCSAAQHDSDGAIVKWLGTCTDIDACKRRQQESEQQLAAERRARDEAERTARTSDELIALLSHELRTPLNAIVGWAQILSGENIDPLRLKKGMEVIARNAALQTRMVNDLLDMNHIMHGTLRLDMQTLDFSALATATIASVQADAAAREVALAAEIGTGLALWGDPLRLQQVMWHLLSNAIKFAPRHSVVHLTLAALPGAVSLSISDRGQGLAAHFSRPAPRLSVDGASGKPSACALSLDLVRNLVELHGGDIGTTGAGGEATVTVLLRQTAPGA